MTNIFCSSYFERYKFPSLPLNRSCDKKDPLLKDEKLLLTKAILHMLWWYIMAGSASMKDREKSGDIIFGYLFYFTFLSQYIFHHLFFINIMFHLEAQYFLKCNATGLFGCSLQSQFLKPLEHTFDSNTWISNNQVNDRL